MNIGTPLDGKADASMGGVETAIWAISAFREADDCNYYTIAFEFNVSTNV